MNLAAVHDSVTSCKLLKTLNKCDLNYSSNGNSNSNSNSNSNTSIKKN